MDLPPCARSHRLRRGAAPSRAAGLTVIELLVSLSLLTLVLSSATMVMSSHRNVHTQQDLVTAKEQNLRTAMETVAAALRGAGYGVPETSLSTWVPWVSGFDANPKITGSSPVTLTVAGCTAPLAHLAEDLDPGDNRFHITSDVPGKTVAMLLNEDEKQLIQLDDEEIMRITGVAGVELDIDTDPGVAGGQGVARAYPTGTPLCRVDAQTFSLATDIDTGLSQLVMTHNQGDVVAVLAEGITAFEVASLIEGREYEITLTGETEKADPLTGAAIASTLRSSVVLRNAR